MSERLAVPDSHSRGYSCFRPRVRQKLREQVEMLLTQFREENLVVGVLTRERNESLKQRVTSDETGQLTCASTRLCCSRTLQHMRIGNQCSV